MNSMNRKTIHPMRQLAGACGLLLFLLAFLLAPACGSAQQGTAKPAQVSPVTATGAPRAVFQGAAIADLAGAPAREAEETPTATSGSGVQQGVKVHGHWVINVKNPDGTLVGHHEFENSLNAAGPFWLTGLMAGYFVPGDYMIVLGANSGNGPCTATYQFCGIVRSLSTYPAEGYCNVYYCTTGLTTTFSLNQNGPTGNSMVLNGTIAVNNTGTIGNVYTLLNTCASIPPSQTTNPSTSSTILPGACPTSQTNYWYGPLTSTTITPIPVTTGQLVQVIVTITFS